MITNFVPFEWYIATFIAIVIVCAWLVYRKPQAPPQYRGHVPPKPFPTRKP